MTFDDAMDVLILEESEDLARSGGAELLGHTYFYVSDFRLARSQVVWLAVLIVAATGLLVYFLIARAVLNL